MLARLTVHFPFQPTRSFVLRGDAETVIGRDPACDIVLDDERVSRRHARLAFKESGWRLFDLDSTNGTSLQGMPTQEAALSPHGWISFGGLLARFEHSSPERERADTRRHEERYRDSISKQRELNPSLGVPKILERVLESVVQLTGAERGAILLKQGDGDLEIAARLNLADGDLTAETFAGSVGAVHRAMATGKTVAVSDALGDPYFQSRESVVAGGIRGLLCIPLPAAQRLIGLIYADSRQPGASYGALDVEILEALAAHAALALVMARADSELKGLAAKLPPVSSWSGVVLHHDTRAKGQP